MASSKPCIHCGTTGGVERDTSRGIAICRFCHLPQGIEPVKVKTRKVKASSANGTTGRLGFTPLTGRFVTRL